MDSKQAKEIIKGRLQFGNPEHIEAVRTVVRDREEETRACDGFNIKLDVYRNSKTGRTITRMTLPKE